MPLITWSPNLELGIAIIDEQHRGLVEVINRLSEINAGARESTAMESIFTELVAYTKNHFATEEDLMRRHAYGRLSEHQLEHRRFVKVLSEFKAKYEKGHTAVSAVMLNFLRDWLAHHILDSDKQLVLALNDRGVH